MKTFAFLGFTKITNSYRSKIPKQPINQSSVDEICLQGLSFSAARMISFWGWTVDFKFTWKRRKDKSVKHRVPHGFEVSQQVRSAKGERECISLVLVQSCSWFWFSQSSRSWLVHQLFTYKRHDRASCNVSNLQVGTRNKARYGGLLPLREAIEELEGGAVRALGQYKTVIEGSKQKIEDQDA